jgi:hypothetical protein
MSGVMVRSWTAFDQVFREPIANGTHPMHGVRLREMWKVGAPARELFYRWIPRTPALRIR